MNKKEYISALRAQLQKLPSSDVEDIIKEFDSHFEIGLSEGKSESEIAAKLGSPSEVAQIYLSDSVPDFDLNTVAQVAPPMPNNAVKTGFGIGRGVGPAVAAGFASGGFAKPLQNTAPKNTAPKPEPDGPMAHTGAKAPDITTPVPPQTEKHYQVPQHPEYPTQDPNHVVPAKKNHDKVFVVLFTVLVFIWAWLIGLGLLCAIIAWPFVTAVCAGVFYGLLASLSGMLFAATLLLAISLSLAVIGELIVAFFAIKGFVIGTIQYIRWAGKTWKEAK